MACLLVMLTNFIITNRPCYFRFSRIFHRHYLDCLVFLKVLFLDLCFSTYTLIIYTAKLNIAFFPFLLIIHETYVSFCYVY
jgi:hypothetical protein